jgi:hypothetical protein
LQTAKFHFWDEKRSIGFSVATARDVVAAQEGKVAVEGERLEWRRHVDRLE